MSHRSIWTYLYQTPFALGWIDVAGVKTRYLEAGRKGAPVVIMLHGTAGSLETFCANIPEHAEHFHVFAIDMMGSGWTDRPDYPYTMSVYVQHVLGFMDAMSVSKASFVGVSLGSGVSAFLAFAHPDRSKSFVMVSPTGAITNQAEWDKLVSTGARSRLDSVAVPTEASVRSLVRELVLHDDNVIDDIVAVRVGIYSSPDIKMAIPHILAPLKELIRPHEDWRNLKTPILVVGSPDGTPLVYETAKLIPTLAPNARRVDIPDTNHWAHFEHPEVFNPLSVEFLRSTA
jgi:2-hydroxy-6-oxonona-2,4-dienedioate hydrolase